MPRTSSINLKKTNKYRLRSDNSNNFSNERTIPLKYNIREAPHYTNKYFEPNGKISFRLENINQPNLHHIRQSHFIIVSEQVRLFNN